MKRILNYPGSKWRMSDLIISQMPKHKTYLEPFFGSGAVYFSKKPSKIETINDLDDKVYNFFKVCRDNPEQLAMSVYLTPMSRKEQIESKNSSLDSLESARRFLVQSWQSIGGIQLYKTGWRSNIDKIGRKVYEWNELPERILEVADRLKFTQIENQDAVKLLQRYNRKDVFAYVDPPYLLSTRKGRYYETDMEDERHYEILEILREYEGKFILSGYDNHLYDDVLKDCYKIYINTQAESGKPRREVLWLNYEPNEQINLF